MYIYTIYSNYNLLLDLDTIGSAAWLGPHLPNKPRPKIPVLPTGLLSKVLVRNIINMIN